MKMPIHLRVVCMVALLAASLPAIPFDAWENHRTHAADGLEIKASLDRKDYPFHFDTPGDWGTKYIYYRCTVKNTTSAKKMALDASGAGFVLGASLNLQNTGGRTLRSSRAIGQPYPLLAIDAGQTIEFRDSIYIVDVANNSGYHGAGSVSLSVWGIGGCLMSFRLVHSQDGSRAIGFVDTESDPPVLCLDPELQSPYRRLQSSSIALSGYHGKRVVVRGETDTTSFVDTGFVVADIDSVLDDQLVFSVQTEQITSNSFPMPGLVPQKAGKIMQVTASGTFTKIHYGHTLSWRPGTTHTTIDMRKINCQLAAFNRHGFWKDGVTGRTCNNGQSIETVFCDGKRAKGMMYCGGPMANVTVDLLQEFSASAKSPGRSAFGSGERVRGIALTCRGETLLFRPNCGEGFHCSVFDIGGKRIRDMGSYSKTQSVPLSQAALANGIYFFRAIGSSGSSIRRFVIPVR